MSFFEDDDPSKSIVDCAYQVHKELGPGFLETVYEKCLEIVLRENGHKVEVQKSIPICFRGRKIENAFKADIIIDNSYLIELKAVDKLAPVHEAQILSYLKMSHIKTGFLINFNVKYFKEGIKRFVI